MSIKKTGVVLVLLFLLTVAVTGPVRAADEPVVLSVEVTGNRHIAEETILRAVSHIRLGEPVGEEALQKDLQAIQNLGYFSMVDVRGEPFLGGIKVVFRVYENPVIQDFKIVGLEVADPAEILSYFTQKKGEVFNYVRTMNDLERAVHDYQEKKGLHLVFLGGNEEMITPEGVVTLHLTEVKIAKILLRGLEKTRESVVKREISLREGEILDLNVLRQDLQRLYRMQLFEEIRPRLEYTSSPERMNLALEFKELNTLGLNIGATYIPEVGRLAGNLGISESNLLGLGQKISLQISSSPGRSHLVEFDFQEPWLDENQTSLGFNLYSRYDSDLISTRSGQEERYSEKRTGMEVTLGRPLTRDLRMSTSLQLQRVDDSRQSGEYWNNSIGLGLVQNKLVYSGMYTTGGYWASVGASLHGGFLGGQYDYNRYTAEFKQFYSPWKNTTMGYRIKGGTTVGEIPPTSQFYLGGPLSLRGYRDRHAEGKDLLLANVELRQRIPNNENLEFVLFYDAGTVDLEEYYQSYGIGLRYTVPFLGKLRFDYGWNAEGDPPEFHFFIEEMF